MTFIPKQEREYMIRKLGQHTPQIHPTAYVDPDASVIGQVKIGANCFVGPGARIRGDNAAIQIGDNSNVQDNAIIHVSPNSPVTIGQHVTISHNAIIHGCTIEDRVLVGMNCVVENGATIYANTILDIGVHISADWKWIVAEPLLIRNHTAKSWANIARNHDLMDELSASESRYQTFTPRPHQLQLILDNAQQYVEHCETYRKEQELAECDQALTRLLEDFQKEGLRDELVEVNAAVAHLQLVRPSMVQ